MPSALKRCISFNWVKACSGHTSLPWSSDEIYGARVAIEGSGPMVGDICRVTKLENLKSIMKEGLKPGCLAHQSGATMLQMSPFAPFGDWMEGGELRPRTNACGRVGDP
eukprot:9751652-Alexandrium_andersonii.AAC.1